MHDISFANAAHDFGTHELSVSCTGAGNQITPFASSNKLLLSILKQTIQGGSQALMTFIQ